MINKLIIAFLIAFFVGAFLTYCIEMDGGMQATKLTAALTESATAISVNSTDGFEIKGVVRIGDEWIKYKNKTDTQFLRCERGYNDTDADAHTRFSTVYNDGASAINDALGFNITKVSSTGGIFAFPVIAGNFITHTLPKLVLFNFSFLSDGPLVWFRYFMMLFSIGLIFTVFYFIFTAVGSVGSTLFSRWT